MQLVMEGFLTEGHLLWTLKTGCSVWHGVNGGVTGRGSLGTKGHDQEEQGKLTRGWR